MIHLYILSVPSFILIYLKRFADMFFDYTSKKSTNGFFKKAKMYRHMQLLGVLLNGIVKGSVITVYVSGFVVVEALALSTFIKNLDSDINFVSILFLWTLDCFVGILIFFGQMGMVHQKSNGLIKIIKTQQHSLQLCARDWKCEERFWRSCSALKIRIGSGNFVDELFSLNCLQVSMSFAANLLMLDRSNS